MPKKKDSTVRRTTSRTPISSTPPAVGLIATATTAECSASPACILDNRSHRTPITRHEVFRFSVSWRWVRRSFTFFTCGWRSASAFFQRSTNLE